MNLFMEDKTKQNNMKTKHYDNNKKLFRFPIDSGSDWRVVSPGGSAGGGAAAGAFGLSAAGASGAAARAVGGQLTLLLQGKNEITSMLETLPLGKTHNKYLISAGRSKDSKALR